MRSRLAAFGITLLASMPARATPPCPGPLEAVSKLDTPSALWKPAANLPGAATSVAGASNALYATAIVDGRSVLYELAGDRWTPIDGAPAATAVYVIDDAVYAFVRAADRTEVAFARRPIKAWTPTTAIPIAASSVFACGAAICASSRALNSHSDAKTYAATPDPSGAIASWNHVLTTGGFTKIGSPTTFGSRSYLVTREGTHANAIGIAGTHGSTWDRVGPPPPIGQPALVGHDRWLFALGGTIVDTIDTVGKCGRLPRHTASHLVNAARIDAADSGTLSSWLPAGPMPAGGAAQFASDGQRLYRFASPSSSTTEVTFAVWTELIDSIEPSAKPAIPVTPPAAPANHPWQIQIARPWLERPAFPIAGGQYAVEWRAESSDPQTVLHVEWIEARYTGEPADGLSVSVGQAFEAFVHGFVSQAPREDEKPGISKSLDVTLARVPHARRLRILGQVRSPSSVAIVAGTCSGEQSALAACEALLETLGLPEPKPQPETTSVLRWIVGLAGMVVVLGLVYWVARRVRSD